jgi:hypothetical protein
MRRFFLLVVRKAPIALLGMWMKMVMSILIKEAKVVSSRMHMNTNGSTLEEILEYTMLTKID